jgi:hypothetical protein
VKGGEKDFRLESHVIVFLFLPGIL